MGEMLRPAETDERRIRNWLLLLLRFAITCEPHDRAAAAVSAAELDATVFRSQRSFTFFERTTAEFCDATVAVRDQRTTAILRKTTAHIQDRRLRAAFCACLDLQEDTASRPLRRRAAWREQQDLWRGLPKR